MRAKMKCVSVTKHDGGIEEVKLSAVNGKNDSANAQWAKWTPCGSVSLSISNPDAQGHFKPGGFYFVDFFETNEEG